MVKKVISVCLVLAFVLSVCVIPSHAVDYSYLQAVLDAWDNFDTTGILSYAIDNAQYEYEAAREYLGSRNQNDIDAAADSFAGVLRNFGIFVDPPEPSATIDYSILSEALETASGYDESDYTSDSWAALSDAVQAGDSVFRTKSADSQDQVNTLANNITNAIRNLKEASGDLYFDDLYDMFGQCDTILDQNSRKQAYTSASITDLLNAYDEAFYCCDPSTYPDQYTIDYYVGYIQGCIGTLVPLQTLTETYVAEAPVAGGKEGYLNQRSYYIDEIYDGNGYIVTEKHVVNPYLLDEDVSVTFEQLFLRTMIQSKTSADGSVDARFVTMVDENIENYVQAGFLYTIDDIEQDALITYEVNSSFIADGETVEFADCNPADGYFVLQNVVFAAEVVTADPTITVTPFVTLTTGETLTGETITFALHELA